MERRKLTNRRRYLLSFTIGTLIFAIGFLISYSIAYIELQRIVSLQDPSSYEIFKDKLRYTLLKKDLCEQDGYKEISEDLRFQGSIIGDLEEKLGKENPSVLFRKKFYTLILLEHFEWVNLINENCHKKINTILFFYSNEEKEIDKSEKIGNILGVLYERNSEDLVIYSLDTNLDSDLMRELRDFYRVNTPQMVILNEKERFERINNIREIEPHLN